MEEKIAISRNRKIVERGNSWIVSNDKKELRRQGLDPGDVVDVKLTLVKKIREGKANGDTKN